MFKCQKCGKSSLPYEKQNKIVVEKRARIYYNVIILDLLNKTKKFLQFPEKNYKILEDLKLRSKEENYKILKDYISKGSETIKEISICDKCK
jgi:hypothetical protein